MAKRIKTELVIKAVDQYSGAIRNMSSVTGRFADKVRNQVGGLQAMRGPLRMIEDYKATQSAVGRSSAALDRSRERVAELRREIRASSNPTKRMTQDFERAQRAAERLRLAHEKNKTELRALGGQLRSAGVNTGDLAADQRRLEGALASANAAFGRQVDKMARLKVMQDRIADGRKRMDASLATAANVSFVGHASMATGQRILRGISGPVQEAIAFESAMSDVRKVVDFETPAAFAQMSEDILEMSTRIPMAATALATITAAGGQAGIPQAELARFAEMAAKIGVAFDISADHAGTFMAQTKTAMRLSLDETGAIFDAMNHLSNNSAARADQTMEFLNRAGADGANFGFNANETLAYGAAMIAAGAGSDTAATSFRNMGRALVRGEGATDRQAAAFGRLGLKAADVAKAMQQDAVGTTTDVMEKLNALPDHMRATVMSDLFGDEARELTKLMNNMQLLPEMLGLVADETSYLGSAQREYDERSKTTANNLQLVRNQVSRLGVSIGSVVLPPLNEMLTKSQAFIDRLVKWTKEHPKLTKWILASGAALGAMAVAGGVMLTAAAGVIGTMAVLRFGLVGLGARAIFAGGSLARVAGGLIGLRKMPRLRLASMVTPLRWGARLVPALPWVALVGQLALSALVKPLRWGARLVPAVPWVALAGKFALSRLVKPLVWGARLLPAISWAAMAGSLNWSSLIRPLAWIGRGALRFIPVIGWALLAGELAWNFLIKPLGWDKFITDVDWSYWFSFEWASQLPQWDWSAIIPDVNLASFFKMPSAMAGTVARSEGVVAGHSGVVRDVMGDWPVVPAPVDPIQFRAKGGSFRAGPLVVGENGAEMGFASEAGYIATNARLRALRALAQSVRVAGLGAMSSVAVAGAASASATVAAPSSAPVSAPSARPSVEVAINGDIIIPVPAGVTDPHAIAEIAANLLGDRVDGALASSFSD